MILLGTSKGDLCLRRLLLCVFVLSHSLDVNRDSRAAWLLIVGVRASDNQPSHEVGTQQQRDAFAAMMKKMVSGDGFLAALDQSGGSTPKALRLYGVPDDVSSLEACSRLFVRARCRLVHFSSYSAFLAADYESWVGRELLGH